MLISLSGKMYSGKTTLADHLVEKYGYTKINFKDELVRECIENYPMGLKILSNRYKKSINELFFIKPYKKEVRALLQDHGALRRKDNPLYWVKKWSNLVNKEISDDIVVDDCRHENEAQVVRDYKGILVRLRRPETDTTEIKHESESNIDKIKCDYTLFNLKDVDHLKSMMDNLMKQL